MDDVLDELQRHVAYSAIAPTTLRGMFDRKGCRSLICDYLAQIRLADLREIGVPEALSAWTAELNKITGVWGPSRKALNLFLRDATYNHWLRRFHRLNETEPQLEVPLDGVVMRRLRELDPDLPTPPSVKKLTSRQSTQFQAAAQRIARSKQTCRIHLDIELWGGGQSSGDTH